MAASTGATRASQSSVTQTTTQPAQVTDREEFVVLGAAALVYLLTRKASSPSPPMTAQTSLPTVGAPSTPAAAPSGAPSQAPAAASWSIVGVSPSPVATGQYLTVAVQVQNTGQAPGTLSVSGVTAVSGIVQGHLAPTSAPTVQPGATAAVTLRSEAPISQAFGGKTLTVGVAIGAGLLSAGVGKRLPSVAAASSVFVAPSTAAATIAQAVSATRRITVATTAPTAVVSPAAPSTAPTGAIAAALQEAVAHANLAATLASGGNVSGASADLALATQSLTVAINYGATGSPVAAAQGAIARARAAISAAQSRQAQTVHTTSPAPQTTRAAQVSFALTVPRTQAQRQAVAAAIAPETQLTPAATATANATSSQAAALAAQYNALGAQIAAIRARLASPGLSPAQQRLLTQQWNALALQQSRIATTLSRMGAAA